MQEEQKELKKRHTKLLNYQIQPNLIQAIFNFNLDDYQENSPFSGDIHMSVNFS